MTVDEILSIFAGQGGGAYFGEAVTVAEHSLQAAYFAERAGASESLVLAALLHDIGHLIEPAPENIADWKADAHHEQIGGHWLASRFGMDVSEPVRLHVQAKRFLCAVDSAYFGALSSASVVTLGLQGGPMSRAEADVFEESPYFREAVRLRRWDDQAKIANLPTPDFTCYRPLIEQAAARRA